MNELLACLRRYIDTILGYIVDVGCERESRQHQVQLMRCCFILFAPSALSVDGHIHKAAGAVLQSSAACMPGTEPSLGYVHLLATWWWPNELISCTRKHGRYLLAKDGLAYQLWNGSR